ncbi:protein NEOXANTHIN-DEFICIENT 1 isoform X2 [Cannabis sativa]|uniref:protein NEOXANTHIN-DEFICIENT 1 isoform X2 n=1 Tax=Cannabis sativa TaxID=3483 RepID=UPI0011E03F08|nr:protein NEOXANTHIN-DEFICIENT 1 isoform X2 [Cannabis sativa]
MANLHGYSKEVHCINSILSKQKLLEHVSQKSLNWLKHLGFLFHRYTLGGFFLANYEDSPAGVFDELVVLAGLVWNPPTSCAWATKVFVNSNEACEHGRKEVGLPSHVASFSKRITAIPKQKSNKTIGFLNMIGMTTTTGTASSNSIEDCMDVQVTEVKSPCVEDSCSFNLTTTLVPAALSLGKWMGPTIKMSLPSFSGRTEYTPDLFKYSCKIQCRVRAVHPTKVSRNSELEQCSEQDKCSSSISTTTMDHSTSAAVMLSKPIFALKFSCMTMEVEAPVVISNCSSSNNPLRTC